MTIIIEDGSTPAGANSYVTIQDYKDYFSNFGVDVSTESDADIEARLKKAFMTHNNIYRGRLLGYKTSEFQAGMFPRENTYDEDCNYLDNDYIHPNVKYWQIEAAKILISEEIEQDLDISGKLKKTRDKIDVIETEVEYTDSGAVQRKTYAKLNNLMRLFFHSSGLATLRLA